MKFTLVIVVLTALNLSASAQWYQILKHKRLPLIANVHDISARQLKMPATAMVKVPTFHRGMTDYLLDISEKRMIRIAQHNMSWRIYDVASYNFSDLAKLYIQQKRLSEAKWYLLQSNTLARRQNDDRHTIANLLDLALVKADMGDVTLAQQDLAEACDIATAHNWNDNVAAIEKEVKFIQQNKTASTKIALRYADDAMIVTKKR
ncbi:MAG: hypothetical protein ACTHNW_02090 [Mucilaginibacter sp.]